MVDGKAPVVVNPELMAAIEKWLADLAEKNPQVQVARVREIIKDVRGKAGWTTFKASEFKGDRGPFIQIAWDVGRDHLEVDVYEDGTYDWFYMRLDTSWHACGDVVEEGILEGVPLFDLEFQEVWAKEIAREHQESAGNIDVVFWYPDASCMTTRVVEVTTSITCAYEIVCIPYVAYPELGVRAPYEMILVHPKEWEASQAGTLALPQAWMDVEPVKVL